MRFAEFKIVPRVPYVPTRLRTLETPVRELEPTPREKIRVASLIIFCLPVVWRVCGFTKKNIPYKFEFLCRYYHTRAFVLYLGLLWDGAAIHCHALTMEKFPLKEGGDDLPQRAHFFDSRSCKTFNRLNFIFQ